MRDGVGCGEAIMRWWYSVEVLRETDVFYKVSESQVSRLKQSPQSPRLILIGNSSNLLIGKFKYRRKVFKYRHLMVR